ncbi:MAG TPA: PKD domain-containing protein [Thioploca sp.]|nr:MAG: hypothetical protein DRR19_03525 [Gammaproteobacteria bacterium]HDN25664.1 PKD domain-containing protein [Thioploca sp.]
MQRNSHQKQTPPKKHKLRVFCRPTFLALPIFLGWSSTASAVTNCDAVTEIPPAECHTLVAFFGSTAGPIWSTRTNWKVTNEPCGWHGVSCNNGHVRYLSLYGNKLTGTLPDLSALSHLESLGLYSNKLSGSIPNLNALTNLKTLNLEHNQLSGPIPDMSGLTKLEDIRLYNNQLTGITSFKGLTSLKSFSASNNQLTGPIPSLNDLNSLGTLELHNNQLSGPLPDTSALGSLKSLYLYNNQLSGLTNFKGLTSLESLNIYNNQLSGPIPSFADLKNVTEIRLYDNQLSGPIPNLDNLTKLSSLDLHDNQLTGPIPDLTNVAELYTLHLQNNQLCGNITPSLIIPSLLSNINLDNNRLTASDPIVKMFLDDKNPSWAKTQSAPGSCSSTEPVDPGTEPVANQSPIATFTVTPNFGEAPLQVNFNASGSSDPDGRIIQYQWASSDGQQTLGLTPSLTFNKVGTHTVTLTVIDNNRATATAAQTVVVTESTQPDPLRPAFTVTPMQGEAPLTVNLNAGNSSPSAEISQYDWSTSDGQITSDRTSRLTFNKPGIHIIALTITGNDGRTESTQQTVIVQSPPVARFMAIPNVVKPSSPEVQLEASASFDADGRVVDYLWTLSNGQIVAGEKPTVSFDREGSYQISLVVTDDDGLSSTNVATQIVTVVPDVEKLAPVAIIDIDDKQAVSQRTVQLSAKRSIDADGRIENYEWHLSDGQTFTEETKELTFPEEGEYLVTLRVTDNDGLTGEESRTVLVGERVLVEFEGMKDFYDIGDLVVVDLIESVNVKSRFDLVDLWVAIKIPTGEVFFRTPLPLKPFDFRPQALKESLQSMDAAHRLLDFEVVPGIGGTYTFYAAYFEEGANPMEHLDELDAILRSNLAIQSTILANE